MTKTQREVYEKLTQKCDEARSFANARDWYNRTYNYDAYSEKNDDVKANIENNFKLAQEGKQLMTANVNSRTLLALEKEGLIVAHIGAGWIDFCDLVNY